MLRKQLNRWNVYLFQSAFVDCTDGFYFVWKIFFELLYLYQFLSVCYRSSWTCRSISIFKTFLNLYFLLHNNFTIWVILKFLMNEAYTYVNFIYYLTLLYIKKLCFWTNANLLSIGIIYLWASIKLVGRCN